jgi:hypothetical protein
MPRTSLVDLLEVTEINAEIKRLLVEGYSPTEIGILCLLDQVIRNPEHYRATILANGLRKLADDLRMITARIVQ